MENTKDLLRTISSLDLGLEKMSSKMATEWQKSSLRRQDVLNFGGFQLS